MKQLINPSICALFFSIMFFTSMVANAQKGEVQKNTYFTIEQLLENKTDKTYGFTTQNPIKVGRNETFGGAFNEQNYLRLLRDAHGDTIIFKRVGTCCAYKSENGFLGNASLNQYEIAYHDEHGKQKTSIIYISHYDYDNPKALYGFTSTKKEPLFSKE